jgi:hypothetical protein
VHASTIATQPLPFGLEPLSFPFPALASLAGRLPHGGGREVALAALTCARLAIGAAHESALTAASRTSRATAAKVWLASVALPSSARAPLARCIEASTGPVHAVAAALRALIAATSPHLDGASVEELELLARRLSGSHG